jgi:hypothetical protein
MHLPGRGKIRVVTLKEFVLPEVVGDEEQFYYCGAVSGGGNKFSNFVGSARTACNCSL